ncbi:MAG: fasciclin domain-containing protein [Acidimicrobiia bacterium]
MAKDPAATAASNNPVLSTLVTAVKAAGLVDTLNGPGPFTIFAPSNDAFAKVDKATLDSLLANPKGDLTKILTYHVIAGQKLDADQLVKAGPIATVQGGKVTVTKSGNDYMVNGAKVICGNVSTANATVMIIDSVLMPS